MFKANARGFQELKFVKFSLSGVATHAEIRMITVF